MSFRGRKRPLPAVAWLSDAASQRHQNGLCQAQSVLSEETDAGHVAIRQHRSEILGPIKEQNLSETRNNEHLAKGPDKLRPVSDRDI